MSAAEAAYRASADAVPVFMGQDVVAVLEFFSAEPQEPDADLLEVMLAVAQGSTNADIAAGLFMSLATVKAHISHILAKLGLSNRTQLALLAHDAGLA